MAKAIFILVMLGVGWFGGAAYMRWSIGQMFAQGEGKSICEAVLAESSR